MSFSATCWAWTLECLKSSEKLTLLAVCQFANEERKLAYPSINSIVAKTGLNRKTVQANLVKLLDKGLLIDTGKRVGDTGSCKVFKVPFLTYLELQQAVPKTGSLENEAIPKTDISDPKNGHEAIPKTGSKPVKEPVNKYTSCKTSVSPNQVAEIYNKVFDGMYPRQFCKMTSSRERVIRSRIKNEDMSSPQDWEEMFILLKNSDWLMGRVTGSNGKPFQLSLEWLCKEENFAKTVHEGAYHGR